MSGSIFAPTLIYNFSWLYFDFLASISLQIKTHSKCVILGLAPDWLWLRFASCDFYYSSDCIAQVFWWIGFQIPQRARVLLRESRRTHSFFHTNADCSDICTEVGTRNVDKLHNHIGEVDVVERCIGKIGQCEEVFTSKGKLEPECVFERSINGLHIRKTCAGKIGIGENRSFDVQVFKYTFIELCMIKIYSIKSDAMRKFGKVSFCEIRPGLALSLDHAPHCFAVLNHTSNCRSSFQNAAQCDLFADGCSRFRGKSVPSINFDLVVEALLSEFRLKASLVTRVNCHPNGPKRNWNGNYLEYSQEKLGVFVRNEIVQPVKSASYGNVQSIVPLIKQRSDILIEYVGDVTALNLADQAVAV